MFLPFIYGNFCLLTKMALLAHKTSPWKTAVTATISDMISVASNRQELPFSAAARRGPKNFSQAQLQSLDGSVAKDVGRGL